MVIKRFIKIVGFWIIKVKHLIGNKKHHFNAILKGYKSIPEIICSCCLKAHKLLFLSLVNFAKMYLYVYFFLLNLCWNYEPFNLQIVSS